MKQFNFLLRPPHLIFFFFLKIRHRKQQLRSNLCVCLLLQVCCARQQLTSVYHLRARMAPRVSTTCTTTCAYALKDQCGSWAGTARSCLTPASLHHAPTAPASPGPTSSPATVPMVSPVSTAPRTWTSVRGSHAMVSAHFVSTGPTGTPATVPLDWEDRPAWTMSPHVQRGPVGMVAPV